MARIDTHHHAVPADYRKALRKAGIDEAGGRALPEWSPDASLATMDQLDVQTAILSVSTPGTTFLPAAADAAALARDLNDSLADIVSQHRDRFGFFATIPMPHIEESAAEVARSLDTLNADGVVLLANSNLYVLKVVTRTAERIGHLPRGRIHRLPPLFTFCCC